MASIYDQIGGAGAIQAAVEIFYTKVLGDELISEFFDDIDMEEQKDKQRKFLEARSQSACGAASS